MDIADISYRLEQICEGNLLLSTQAGVLASVFES